MEVLGEEVLDVGIDQVERMRRRKLLPWWVIGFSWLFMLIGVAAIISLPFAAFGISFNLSLYGIETTEPLSLTGMLVTALFILKAFTAYSLWFEKDWAIKVGYLDAFIGILICVFVMWVIPFFMEDLETQFKIEIFFLLGFIFILKKKQSQWENSHID
jgi:hypothetical protein